MKYDTIEITKASPDGLTGETWRFFFIDKAGKPYILLNVYTAWKKKTSQHKAEPVRHWQRYAEKRFSTIRRDQVSIPPEIQQQAMSQLFTQLKENIQFLPAGK